MADNVVSLRDRPTLMPPAKPRPRARNARRVQLRVDIDEDAPVLQRQLKMLADAASRAYDMARDLTRSNADPEHVRTHIRGVLMATNRALNARRRNVKIKE